MDPSRRQGRPEEELFFNQSPTEPEPDDLAVQPLKITKSSSPAPPQAIASAAGPVTPPSFSQQQATTYTPYHPASYEARPSSSAVPPSGTAPSQNTPPSQTSPHHHRAHYAANDPRRPSIMGYGQPPPPQIPADSTSTSTAQTFVHELDGGNVQTSRPAPPSSTQYKPYSPSHGDQSHHVVSPPEAELPAADFLAVNRPGGPPRAESAASDLTTMAQAGSPMSLGALTPTSGAHTPTQQSQPPLVAPQAISPTNLASRLPTTSSDSQASSAAATRPLEDDVQNLHLSGEQPPAYSSVPAGGIAGMAGAAGAASAAAAARADSKTSPSGGGTSTADEASASNAALDPSAGQIQQSSSPAPAPASDDPSAGLPEGWIAHMDPSSGRYYYIHMPSQHTQWEKPEPPSPLPAPALTTGPGLTPGTAAATSTSPAHSASSGYIPPSGSGEYQASATDLYKVRPSNGAYFGPYLRYMNLDIPRGVWYGSIMLVTQDLQPPTIHIHQAVDLSPNPRQLQPNMIQEHHNWKFWRYDVDLKLDSEQEVNWIYAITSRVGCIRYEFTVASRAQTSWRFIAQSGAEFALSVSANERSRLGGTALMWKDVLQRHKECRGFHVQLGSGNQIDGDRLWKDVPLLRQWTAMSGKENRKNATWTAQHEDEVRQAYFYYYTSHYDQDYVRDAFAQIPQIITLDDHDIFDGYGSYPEYMQSSNIFQNVGRVGLDMYLLFQHHTTLEMLRQARSDFDLFTITGTGWHFLKYLGPAIVVVGPDCRSERTQRQVLAGPTYQGLFPKIAMLPPHVRQCIWMVPVPVVYPRLPNAEQIAHTMAQGKKAVTGTFNAMSKVAGSVAGILGAKEAVGDGFNSVKKAVGKSGLMSNVLSPFGELDVMDELRDQWTHESKDLERTYFIRTLQGIAQSKALRMTFLSGATNCCGAGMVHDPSHPADFKTMYQIIAASIVNAPPNTYVFKLMSSSSSSLSGGHSSGGSSKDSMLYIPPNGRRSGPPPQQPTDTKEDMLDLFTTSVTGQTRDMRRLMERRNYAVFVGYNPDTAPGPSAGSAAPGAPPTGLQPVAAGMGSGGQQDTKQVPGQESVAGTSVEKVSLAVDFMVQGDPSYRPAAGGGATVKYGPILIPSVDWGR